MATSTAETTPESTTFNEQVQRAFSDLQISPQQFIEGILRHLSASLRGYWQAISIICQTPLRIRRVAQHEKIYGISVVDGVVENAFRYVDSDYLTKVGGNCILTIEPITPRPFVTKTDVVPDRHPIDSSEHYILDMELLILYLDAVIKFLQLYPKFEALTDYALIGESTPMRDMLMTVKIGLLKSLFGTNEKTSAIASVLTFQSQPKKYDTMPMLLCADLARYVLLYHARHFEDVERRFTVTDIHVLLAAINLPEKLIVPLENIYDSDKSAGSLLPTLRTMIRQMAADTEAGTLSDLLDVFDFQPDIKTNILSVFTLPTFYNPADALVRYVDHLSYVHPFMIGSVRFPFNIGRKVVEFTDAPAIELSIINMLEAESVQAGTEIATDLQKKTSERYWFYPTWSYVIQRYIETGKLLKTEDNHCYDDFDFSRLVGSQGRGNWFAVLAIPMPLAVDRNLEVRIDVEIENGQCKTANMWDLDDFITNGWFSPTHAFFF